MWSPTIGHTPGMLLTFQRAHTIISLKYFGQHHQTIVSCLFSYKKEKAFLIKKKLKKNIQL